MKKSIIILSIFMLNTSNIKNKEYCDIKGNVHNPGMYEIKENYTIQDVINDAGGLKDDSYTDNINLSKKVTDEMVIYIFDNDEINSVKEVMTCNCEPTYKYIECPEIKIEDEIIENNIIIETTIPSTEPITTTKKEEIEEPITENIPTTEPIIDNEQLININTCTKEELLKLNGLGEVKAEAIIEYRNEYGFFNDIEEIKNVKGIGNAIFEKIKEYITT